MNYLGFWSKLLENGPIVGMSPMDGVTDAPMRYMVARHGRVKNSSNPVIQYPSGGQKLENWDTGKLGNYTSGVSIIFTEFVSVDALRHAKDPQAVDRLMKTFLRAKDVGQYSSTPVTQLSSEAQKQEYRGTGTLEYFSDFPYEVAQVFGHEPQLFYQAAVIVATLGYDGMDINMGCPAHKVEEHGSGAGLIRTPEIAQEIIRQAKKGIQDWVEGIVTIGELDVSEAVKQWVKEYVEKYSSTPVNQYSSGERKLENRNTGILENRLIPVSVKTRIGVDHEVAEWWMEQLMEVEPAMISLHGRTLKQLYQGEADWEAIGRAAKVVHRLGGRILGNGDVLSLEDGMNKVGQYGVDGFLIGRAAEGNPGIFCSGSEPEWEVRRAWMIEHATVYERVYGAGNFIPMRKHLAWYCKGFPGASEMRGRLVRANSAGEVNAIVAPFAY